MAFYHRAGVLISFVFICLWGGAFSAAKTLEIQTENFTFIGDVSAADGKRLLTDLEQYREAIFQILGVAPAPEYMRVRIYAVNSEKELEAITGRTGVAGVYTTTLSGPIFVLMAKGGFRRGNNQARQIALHEYTHHLLSAYSNNVYPRWYGEGLANYYSTFQIDKKGRIIVGRPYNFFGPALRSKNWMLMDVLINAVRDYPFKNYGGARRGTISDSELFYAQSWLAVHYLKSHPQLGPQLEKYIALINNKEQSSDSFGRAFGMTPTQFEAVLRKYIKTNKFSVLTITPKQKFSDTNIRVRILSKNMSVFHKAQAMRYFHTRKPNAKLAYAQFLKAETLLGSTAEIWAARADLAIREQKYDTAQTYIDKALALDDTSSEINRIAGAILVLANRQQNSVNFAALQKSRTYLKKALIADPDNVTAHYYYAMSYSVDRKAPDQQALASVEIAIDYYRNINFVDTNLDLVPMLMAAKENNLARFVTQKALVWSRSADARIAARNMEQQD
jgi:tetratricopeptide (TPR) repeat protein